MLKDNIRRAVDLKKKAELKMILGLGDNCEIFMCSFLENLFC